MWQRGGVLAPKTFWHLAVGGGSARMPGMSPFPLPLVAPCCLSRSLLHLLELVDLLLLEAGAAFLAGEHWVTRPTYLGGCLWC